MSALLEPLLTHLAGPRAECGVTISGLMVGEGTERQAATSRGAALMLLTGYRRTQCLGTAVRLGLFDRLRTDAATAGELADTTGANSRHLSRLLRALAAMEVLVEAEDGRFLCTDLGRQFTSEGLGPAARYMVSEPQWHAWRRLEDSVRTGETGFDIQHGMSDWDYYAGHPETGAMFDAAMRSMTGPAAAPIVAAHDFSKYATVADIGGGDGTLLIAILEANPQLHGTLFERPSVIDRAVARLTEAGLGDRWRVVSGDFREGVAGGLDAYVMKWILHDWEDREAIRILEACRRAMGAGAELIVVERVMPERLGPKDLEVALADLQMMVMNGGVERTESEFRALLDGTGFRLEGVAATGTPVSVLRAVAV